MSENEQNVVCRSGPWSAVASRSRPGQIYYFNTKTGERSWDKPPLFDCQCENDMKSTTEESLNNSECTLKMKTSSKQPRNASAPYPKRRGEDASHKSDVSKQVKKRKNLGTFAHTFNPPAKSSTNTTPEGQSTECVVPTTLSSSAFSQVSVNLRNKKSPGVLKAPNNVFGEEEIENKAEDPSKNWQSAVPSVSARISAVRSRLSSGVLKSSTLPDNQSRNRPDMAPDSSKYVPVKQANSSAELAPVLRPTEKSSSGKTQLLIGGEVSAKLFTEQRQPYLRSYLPHAKRKRGGLGEERLRNLRNQFAEELSKKPDEKEQSSRRLPQDPKEPAKRKGLLPTPPSSMSLFSDPKEPAKRKGLLPTPPSSMRIDGNSNIEKNTIIVPEGRAARRRLFTRPPDVIRLDTLNSRKNIQNVTSETTRKVLLPTPEYMKIDDNSNITKNVSPNVSQHQENLTNVVTGHSSDFISEVSLSDDVPAAEISLSDAVPAAEVSLSDDVPAAEVSLSDAVPAAEVSLSDALPAAEVSLSDALPAAEVSLSDVVPAAEVFESEAMEVDEEARVLSDIKALRTTVTWKSFQTEWTPMEIENVGFSSDTPMTAIIVLDTNILLSHLSFVQELRDSVKLYGDHPFLYLPWMVLQELDRLKERNAKAAKAARAAVSFLNDSFKRKHPRVRGQTGREASRSRRNHVEELCPDDSILKSCLQLQEQGFHTLLLSNDVSLCNKALVHNIKAVTKIQLTNEMLNSAEVNRLQMTGRSPSPVKKVSVMDRLRIVPTKPQPIKVQPQSNRIETTQTTPVWEGLKNTILDTFSKILSTGMEAEYGLLWTKRVLYKPPWELTNIFICLAKHWFALCGETTPETVQKAANELRKIFLKSANTDSIGKIIELTVEIFNRLPSKYDNIIAPLQQQIQSFSTCSANITPDQNCQYTENQSNPDTDQPSIPSVYCVVLAYFGSLWNILLSFCINLKQKLDNGISLDSDTRNHCKEMLSGTSELISNIKGILLVSENELVITHPELQGIFDILRSATPPPGAEPLHLQHIYSFCIHPDKRGVLRNGLSQLEDCETLLVNALKAGNNNSGFK